MQSGTVQCGDGDLGFCFRDILGVISPQLVIGRMNFGVEYEHSMVMQLEVSNSMDRRKNLAFEYGSYVEHRSTRIQKTSA